MKTFIRIVGWTVLGTLTAFLVAYLPGALGIVDDYKYGRVIGKLVFPTIAAFLLSAILYASSAKRAATAIAAAVLVGYLALDAWAIVLHVTGGWACAEACGACAQALATRGITEGSTPNIGPDGPVA